MSTVFSHIVQKRLSRENENVATEALYYVLDYSAAARNGIMKFLRGVVPELPDLRFQTQKTDENARPDMWGYDANVPRVFIENKFWAGLTENQPVTYLERLAKHPQPTLLLMVVPELRQETVWRELRRRIVEAKFSTAKLNVAVVGVRAMAIQSGCILALTSWKTLLDAIGKELTDQSQDRRDLDQLRSLCDASDNQAFLPISPAELSDQRTPALVLQLSSIVQEAIEKAISANSLFKGRLKPQADWGRIGQYATVSSEHGVGVWFGIHFGLWKKYGETPLWAIFSGSNWGRAGEVRPLLEPWAKENVVFTANHPTDDFEDESFVVAINIKYGEEKDQVTSAIAERIEKIAAVLSVLKTAPAAAPNTAPNND